MADEPTEERAQYAREFGTLVGEGASRKCYWDGKSRWAYKFIITTDSWNNKKANIEEIENYNRLNEIDLGVIKVPEMRLLRNGVMAVEYIKGKHPETDCWAGQHECGNVPECWYNRINGYRYEMKVQGFKDISLYNVIEADDGNYYMIDLEY